MKKLVLVLSFIIGLSYVAGAQIAAKSPERRAAQHTKALQKHLNLSQAQAAQVQTAFLTMATRMDSLKSVATTDKKQKQLMARSIKLETKKRVFAILNDTQKQQYATWEKIKRENHKEKKAETTVGQG